jgi:spore maturation protein CgeB
MRILVVYPGHAHSTIDVAVGYEDALRELGHEVHGYNYHNSLSFYMGSLDYWEKTNPDFKRMDGDFLILASERLAVEAIDFVPDVVLVVCGMALHRRGYELIDRLALPIFIMFTESPYADETQAQVGLRAPGIRGLFVNDKSSIKRIWDETDIESEYLPHSYDPKKHYVYPGQKNRDVYFHGTLWPERMTIFSKLIESKNGYNIHIDGIDPAISVEDYEENGVNTVPNEELARNYSLSRISINHHRTLMGVTDDGTQQHIRTAYSLGPRAYEIAACGGFQLCDDDRPELREIFGDTVATYSGSDNLLEQVTYYLRHEDEREAMAEQAREKVLACTFKDRAEKILVPFIEEVT